MPFASCSNRFRWPDGVTSQKPVDSRVYIDLPGLIALRHEARGLSFLPRAALRSPHSGRHASRLRGRGLDLEELRQYYPGDDIRRMDWKATIRTGKPHVRTYTEERDRPVLLLVDQRISMFFGSRHKMKSVTAAEISALAAWSAISSEDRIGALIFNDDSVFELRPQQNPSAVPRLLHALVAYNSRLKVGGSNPGNDAQLNGVLLKAEKLCTHDFFVILVSDLKGLDKTSVKRIKRIVRHNDIMILHVFDPLEKHLPPKGRYVVSDGQLQMEFDAGAKDIQKRFSDHFVNRVHDLSDPLKKHLVPVIQVDTVHPVEDQIRRAMSGRSGRTR
jgi:uncharacterized protein (DUF58 family)